MREQCFFFFSVVLQCHLQSASAPKQNSTRAGGQTRAVAFHSLSPWDQRVFPLPLSFPCVFQFVPVCDCKCRSEHNGHTIKVRGCGGEEIALCLCVCGCLCGFSLLWLTTKIPYCSSLTDMAFSFPSEPFFFSPTFSPYLLSLPSSPSVQKFCFPLVL